MTILINRAVLDLEHPLHVPVIRRVPKQR